MSASLNGLNIRRLYYSTSDVSEIVQVPVRLLRIWENKFPDLKPTKSKSGRRLFKPKDLWVVITIKKLKDAGYTDEKIINLLKHHSVKELINKDLLSNQNKIHKMMLLSEIYTDLNEILSCLKIRRPIQGTLIDFHH